MLTHIDPSAGVTANSNASKSDYALASLGKDGKARMGHTDRIGTGAEMARFVGWRHMSPDVRETLLPQISLSIIVDHWYGDLKDGKGRSNMDNAERLLALYAAAPDDSRASMEQAWKQYKDNVDPRPPVTPAATAFTAEEILAALASNPALLQALQGLQQQVPQGTLATTKAKAAERYRAAKAARENG